MEKKNVITGIALDENVAKVGVLGVPDQPGIAATIFGALAEEKINVDMIIQSIHAKSNAADMAFTVSSTDLKKAEVIAKRVATQLHADGVVQDDSVCKLSIVGVGMISQPGVAAKMFETLSKEKINIQMISTSEIKISCVISRSSGKQAVKALHKAFELDK